MSNRTANLIVVIVVVLLVAVLSGAIDFGGGDALPTGSPADSGVAAPVPDVAIEIPQIPTPVPFVSPTSGMTIESSNIPAISTPLANPVSSATQAPKPYSYQGISLSEIEAKEALERAGYGVGFVGSVLAWAKEYRGGDLADVSRFSAVNTYLDEIDYHGESRGAFINYALNWADQYHGGGLKEVGRYFWETFGIGAPVNNYAQARADWQSGGNVDQSWIGGDAEHSFTYGADYGNGQLHWSQDELSALFQQDGYDQQDIDKIFTEYAPSRDGNIAGAEAWIYDQNTAPAFGGISPTPIPEYAHEKTETTLLYEGRWLEPDEVRVQVLAYCRIWGFEPTEEDWVLIFNWAVNENGGSLQGYKTFLNKQFNLGL